MARLHVSRVKGSEERSLIFSKAKAPQPDHDVHEGAHNQSRVALMCFHGSESVLKQNRAAFCFRGRWEFHTRLTATTYLPRQSEWAFHGIERRSIIIETHYRDACRSQGKTLKVSDSSKEEKTVTQRAALPYAAHARG